jgi:hypothetical protein
MCQEKRSSCKNRSQEPKENLYALDASVLIRKKVLKGKGHAPDLGQNMQSKKASVKIMTIDK